MERDEEEIEANTGAEEVSWESGSVWQATAENWRREIGNRTAEG